MVEREGHMVDRKKLRRIYTEEKLQVHRTGGRKRALGTKKPMVLPDGPNQRWSLDFVSDALTDGRRFRILAVVDDFGRENLVLVADRRDGHARSGFAGIRLRSGSCRPQAAPTQRQWLQLRI